ncbi:unnamed protein product [Auanema sp. JU1783]|nr:unnamed protein product [Auanema sp. JU1783]
MSSPATVLEPTIHLFDEAFNNCAYNDVVDFYHPDAVLVQKGKEATYGKDNMLAFYKGFGDMIGKSDTTITDKTFEGSENYITYGGKFVTETEKLGTMKGWFSQVWKKEGGKWLVIYDIFGTE